MHSAGGRRRVRHIQNKEPHRLEKYNLITLDTSSLPAPQEPVRDGFVQLKNVRMHYVIYGSGEQPLVLIHGNGGSAKSLAEAASYLATTTQSM